MMLKLNQYRQIMLHFIFLLAFFGLVGLGPTFYFQPVLKRKTIYSFFILSIFFGLTLSNLTVLIFGQFGFKSVSSMLKYIYIILAAFSLILFVILLFQRCRKLRKKTVVYEVKKAFFLNFDKNDILPLIIFASFFLYTFIVIKKYFFINSDHFNFWLTDAKLIFVTDKLRFSSDIIGKVTYSSYYPLHGVILYKTLGYIAEQFTIFFTVFYAILGTYLSYSFTKNKSFHTKLITTLLLVIVNISLFPFTTRFYADIPLASILTFFFFILFKKVPSKLLIHKIFLLTLSLIIFFLLKEKSVAYIIILIIVFLFYEKDFLRKYLKISIKKQKKFFVFFILFLFTLILSTIYYKLNYKIFGSSDKKATKVFTTIFTPTEISTEYIKQLYESFTNALLSILEMHPFLFVIYTFFLSSLMKVEKNKKTYALAFILIIFPLANVSLATINDHVSSLRRYVTLVFYCIPILSPLVLSKFPKYNLIKKSMVYIIMIIIILLNSYGIMFYNYREIHQLGFHTGEYLTAEKGNSIFPSNKKYLFRTIKWFKLNNKKFDKIISRDDSILIAQEIKLSNVPVITNWRGIALVSRYFLVENIIGGSYRTKKTEYLHQIIKKREPDYIFVINPGPLLTSFCKIPKSSNDNFYLVKINKIDLDKYKFQIIPFNQKEKNQSSNE